MTLPSDRHLRILRLLVAGVKLELSDSTTKYELTITSPGVSPATLTVMKDAGWLEQDPEGRWRVTDAGRTHAGVASYVRDFIGGIS